MASFLMLHYKLYVIVVTGGVMCIILTISNLLHTKGTPCVRETFQQQVQFSSSVPKSSLWRWQNNYSRTCDVDRKIPDESTELPFTRCDKIAPASHHDRQYTRQQLRTMQSCVLAALDYWTKLASDIGIYNWSIAQGSLVGLICYEAMIPWDDDIDVAIFGQDCRKLEQFFDTLPLSSLQQDREMISKNIDANFTLHKLVTWLRYWNYAMSILRQETVYYVNKFKVRHNEQPFMGNILGLDVDCYTMPKEAINSTKIDTVKFGPTQTRILKFQDTSVLGFTSVTCLA